MAWIDRQRSGIRIPTAHDFRTHCVRSLYADSDEAGGFLLTSKFYARLLEQEAERSVMRGLGYVMEPLGEGEESVAIPSLEAAMADATWTSELGAATHDSTASFGKRELTPHPLDKRVKVSRKLLRSSENAGSWIEKAISNALGAAFEAACWTGSGSGEPVGILTAADAGDVPTYTTSNSGEVSGDDIREWLYSLPARFLNRQTRIVTTPDFVKHLVTLKDGAGNYIITEGLASLFDRLVFSDGLPAILSGGALVAGEFAAVLGNFGQGFWIVDAEEIDMQILTELYAEDGEIGYAVTQWSDAMPVIPTAFYALKIKE